MQRNAHTYITTVSPVEAILIFMGIYFVLATFLHIIDFVPEHKTSVAHAAPVVTQAERVLATSSVVSTAPQAVMTPPSTQSRVSAVKGAVPTRVVISKIGVDTPVVAPNTTNIAALDAELLKGAVFYPGSATLDQEGSPLIFGHQSYLPVVRNKAFKAFNDLQRLERGDSIVVYSGSTAYTYEVRSVVLVTTDVDSIPLETLGRALTLVTCNSLGAKEERYIIKADLVSVK